MKDDDAIPFEPVTDEATEARIVAWVLGEASAFEITELERLCAEKPELEIFRRRMLAMQGLLKDSANDADDGEWKLPATKRERVLETIGADSAADAAKDKRVSRNGLRVMFGIAACLLVTLVVMRLVNPHAQRKYAQASISEEKLVAFAPAAGGGSLDDLRNKVLEQEQRVEEQRRELSQVVREKNIVYRGSAADLESKSEALKGEKRASSNGRGLDTREYLDAKENFETEVAKLQDLKLRFATESAVAATPAAPAAPSASEMAQRARAVTAAPHSPSEPELASGKEVDQSSRRYDGPVSSGKPASHPEKVDAIRRDLYMAEGNFNLGKYDDAKKAYEEVVRADPYNAAARRGLERIASAKSDYYRAAYDHTRAELLSQVDAAWGLPAPAQDKGQGVGTGFGVAAADPAGMPESKVNMEDNIPADGFADFESKNAMTAKPAIAGAPDAFAADPATDVTDIMTGGLRSGDNAITRGNIDAILDHPIPTAEGSNSIPSFLGGDMDDSGSVAALDRVTPGEPMADPFAADNESTAKLEAAMPAKDQLAKQMEEKSKLALREAPVFDAEIITAEEPFSTFSLNVSDVSFQLAKAALERGEQPAPESIKVEQFYNAVDYGDAAPSSGEPVAGVVEQSVHPVIPGRNLVRMGVRTAAAGRSAAQPLRLTLLVDQSGSMVRDDRKVAMEKAVAGLGQLLTEVDRISVIGFSRTSRLVAENLPGNRIAELGALVNPEASEGGTNLEEALKLSEVIANRHKLDGAQNRVVLFTDGAANLGDADPARLAEKVKAMRQAGIAFDVAGIGAEDLNDRLLAELARNGNGRYYVAADNLAAQLAGAFRPAAEDVKVQVRFNPQRVKGYRLVGFEESRLKTEDFRNDAIDAAELAAEEAAVALYQVEVLPGGTGEIGEMSVRFREAGTGNTVERSWTIPYDSATPAFDKATPSMKLAGLSTLAAEKLKGGPLADAINLRELAKPLADAKKYYKDSRKVADMARVIELLAK